MRQISIPQQDPILAEVLQAYDFPATLLGAVRYGQGHINDTFCVLCQPQEGDCIRFILWALTDTSRIEPLCENFAHLEKVYEATVAANANVRYTNVEG